MSVASKLARAVTKKLTKEVAQNDSSEKEALDLLADTKKIDDWKKQNPNPNPQIRNPKVQEAANKVLEGEITGKQYRSIVKENTPIKKIEEVPDIPTFKEIVGSLNKDKSSKGILGLTKNIEDGTRVSSRLDIPAYEKHDVWVVSVHDALDKKGRVDSLQGDILGYGKTAVLKNVEFKTLPQGASKIAANRADKGTIARIFGDYYNENPATTKARAEQLLNDPEWTQVGFNPFKHGYFYDKDTSMPIKSADEVLQVGALVLAKNAQKFKISEAKKLGTQGGLKIRTSGNTQTVFNKGGTIMEKQEGGLAEDGGTIEEESGNEVPVGSLESEVRDDIDAKLSEGEFVFPADVVRFIGLNKLMAMRQKAKQGLQKMEDMGQMGNAEEATMEDDGEWNEDAMIEPEVKMAPGGLVSTTSNQSSRFAGLAPTPVTVEQQPMQEEDEEILDVEEDDIDAIGDDPEDEILSYSELMPKVENLYAIKQYYDPNSKRIYRITLINGKPTSPIPDHWLATDSDEFKALMKEEQKKIDTTTIEEMNGIAPETDNKDTTEKENEERREHTKQVLGLTETATETDTISALFGTGSDASNDPLIKRFSRAVLMNTLGIPLWAAIAAEKLGVTKKLAGAIDASLEGDTSEEVKKTLEEGKNKLISGGSLEGAEQGKFIDKYNLGEGVISVQAHFDGKKDVYDYLNGKDKLTVMFGSTDTRGGFGNVGQEYYLEGEDRGNKPILAVTGEIGYNAGDMDPTTGGIFNNAGQAVDIRTNKLLNSYNTYDNFMLGKKLAIETGWFGGEISYDTWSQLSPEGKIKYEKYYLALQREGIEVAKYGRNETPFQHQMNKLLETGSREDILNVAQASIVTDSEGNAVRSSQNGTPVTSMEGSFLTNRQKNQLADVLVKNELRTFAEKHDYQYDTSIEQFLTAIDNNTVKNKNDLVSMIAEDQEKKAQEYTPFEPSSDMPSSPSPTLIQTDSMNTVNEFGRDEGEQAAYEAEQKRIKEAEAQEAQRKAQEKADAEEAEKRRRDAETARLNAIAQREQEKAQREQEKADREAREQASREKRVGGQGIVRAKGGLAYKPEKKTMKRGGLASKK